MRLALYPRLSPAPGTARVMVALFDVAANATPQLSWSLDNQALQPVVVRALAPVQPSQAARKHTRTGVFELRGLSAGRQYRLSVGAPSTVSAQLWLEPLPSQLPSPQAGGFHVLLASCFHETEANGAQMVRALRDASGALPARPSGGKGPHCAFFMGDQVYLDMPISEDIPDNPASLLANFERKYRINWESSLAHVLRAAPAVHLPDDHEFWNNYPYSYGLAENTRRPDGRKRWADAAKAMLTAFQDVKPYTRFDVSPVSFFLADGRTERDPQGRLHTTITVGTRTALEGWVDDLNRATNNPVGVFVTGQSFLSKPTENPLGAFEDAEPANYREFDSILRIFYKANFPLLLVTGDVHFGRVTLASRLSRPPICEVIVSPLSSVKDQLRRAKNLGRLVAGLDDKFEGDFRLPERPPAQLGLNRTFPTVGMPERATCRVAVTDPQRGAAAGVPALFRGDQLATLSFEHKAGKVSAYVTYWLFGDKSQSHRVRLL